MVVIEVVKELEQNDFIILTSLREFIFALKCGDFNILRATSSRKASTSSTSFGHIFMHKSFIEASKSETLPTF